MIWFGGCEPTTLKFEIKGRPGELTKAAFSIAACRCDGADGSIKQSRY